MLEQKSSIKRELLKIIFFHRGCYDLSLEPNLKRILTYKAPKSRGHNLCLRNFKAWLIQATPYREFKNYRTDQLDPHEVRWLMMSHLMWIYGICKFK